MLKNVPLAPNPKRAMLMTINDKWFHCPMAKTRVRRTSKARVAKDIKKIAINNIIMILDAPFYSRKSVIYPSRAPSAVRTARR
jgi:hypothetical protein